MQRQIRDRPLGSHQSVAHTLADQWVANQAVLSAARINASGEQGQLAVALGTTHALRSLADDAVRLRGGNGYLVDDVAAQCRVKALALARRLGDPDVVAARLGETAVGVNSPAGRRHDEVESALDGVWDEQRATDADIRGVLHDPELHRAVASRGWLGRSWPMPV